MWPISSDPALPKTKVQKANGVILCIITICKHQGKEKGEEVVLGEPE
jgi:hypothetical protein